VSQRTALGWFLAVALALLGLPGLPACSGSQERRSTKRVRTERSVKPKRASKRPRPRRQRHARHGHQHPHPHGGDSHHHHPHPHPHLDGPDGHHHPY
jgi:hypothetical protein